MGLHCLYYGAFLFHTMGLYFPHYGSVFSVIWGYFLYNGIVTLVLWSCIFCEMGLYSPMKARP